jgi:20S proteasome alpha/beta subunit
VTAFIVGGYESDDEGSARIYQLGSATDFAPMVHDYGFAVAGVAQYALYLLNRLYEQDRSVEELTALAIYAVTETASQDGKVGGPVNVVTISEHGGADLLEADQVGAVMASNETRSRALRDSFYQREPIQPPVDEGVESPARSENEAGQEEAP